MHLFRARVFFSLSCLVNIHSLKYSFNFISVYSCTYFTGLVFCIKLNGCIHYHKCIVTCHTIYTISFILNNTAAHAIIHQNQTLIIEVGNCTGCGLVINSRQGVVQQTGSNTMNVIAVKVFAVDRLHSAMQHKSLEYGL